MIKDIKWCRGKWPEGKWRLMCEDDITGWQAVRQHSEPEYWCEHCDRQDNHLPGWKFCPICAAPRPEDRK